MKKTNLNYIGVTKALTPVMERLAERVYGEWKPEDGRSLEEFREWVLGALKGILRAGELGTAVIKYRERKLHWRISGKLGNVSFVNPREREPYGRRLPAKPYKITEKRRIQQERMRQAVSAWKEMSVKEKEVWNKSGRRIHIGGVYLFRGIYIRLLVDGNKIPQPLIPTRQLMAYYQKRRFLPTTKF